MHRDTISHSVYLPNPLPLFVYPQGNSACMLVHVVTCVYVDTCSTCTCMYADTCSTCTCVYVGTCSTCTCVYVGTCST